MKSITEIIKPITLLYGSHSDTGETGRGCVMNVIAYLNGEPQITDKSPCVCVTVRPLMIYLNDALSDAYRPRLLPYIERAMGSVTDDVPEMRRRLALIVDLARSMTKYAAKYAEYAKYAAAKSAAEYAKYAAAKSAEYAESAAKSAESAAKSAKRQNRQNEIIDSMFVLLDNILPHAKTFPDVIMRRAEILVSVASHSKCG